MHPKYFKMKKVLVFLLVSISAISFGQDEPLNLKNALIVGQLDKEGDRFSTEITLTEFFSSKGVKSIPSLNLLKQGADLTELAEDSLQNVLKNKGIDTYILVSVRGYDRRFKPSEKREDFKTALSYGTLFSLYRPESVSVTFEFFIYRNGELIRSEMIKCGNISSRATVLTRLIKKLEKKYRKW